MEDYIRVLWVLCLLGTQCLSLQGHSAPDTWKAHPRPPVAGARNVVPEPANKDPLQGSEGPLVRPNEIAGKGPPVADAHPVPGAGNVVPGPLVRPNEIAGKEAPPPDTWNTHQKPPVPDSVNENKGPPLPGAGNVVPGPVDYDSQQFGPENYDSQQFDYDYLQGNQDRSVFASNRLTTISERADARTNQGSVAYSRIQQSVFFVVIGMLTIMIVWITCNNAGRMSKLLFNQTTGHRQEEAVIDVDEEKALLDSSP